MVLRLPSLLRHPLGAAALVAVATAALLLAAQRLGPTVLLALAAGVVGLLMLERPGLAVGIIVGTVVALESNPEAAFSGSRFYEYAPGFQIYPVEIMLVLVLGATAIDVVRTGDYRSPGPFMVPLGILALGMIAGAVTGSADGAEQEDLQEGLRTPLLLLLMPFAVSHILGSRDRLRRAAGAVAAMAGAKSVFGLLVLFAALGPVAVNGERVTYLESTANFIAMAFVLGVLSMRFAKVPLPRWIAILTPIALLSLTLSYRRSYWIATVACIAVVVLVATSTTSRRLVFPAIAVVVLSLVMALQSGSTIQLEGGVGERLSQLSPSEIRANPQDRYRLGERRNVLAELKESPITGLGVGVPWRAQYPLSLENPGGRTYTHVATLWFWMKFGLLGLAAYVGLVLCAIAAALRIWRRHPDTGLAAIGLAGGISVLGLAIAETTATFIGAEPRMSIVVGALIGALAALVRDAGDGPVLR